MSAWEGFTIVWAVVTLFAVYLKVDRIDKKLDLILKLWRR